MKIQNERPDALTPQESTRAAKVDGQAFEDLLARQLEQSAESQPGVSSGLEALNNRALLLEGSALAMQTASLENAFEQTNALLDSVEVYARTLGSGQDPKAAWAMLEGMDTQLRTMRAELGTLGSQNNGLETVINELEVLTATEKFKFNRGDYQ